MVCIGMLKTTQKQMKGNAQQQSNGVVLSNVQQNIKKLKNLVIANRVPSWNKKTPNKNIILLGIPSKELKSIKQTSNDAELNKFLDTVLKEKKLLKDFWVDGSLRIDYLGASADKNGNITKRQLNLSAGARD